MLNADKLEGPERERFALSRTLVFQGLLFFGAVVAFAFLLIELETREFLSPLLLGLAVGVMVWPLREQKVVRALLLAGGGLVLLYVLSLIGEVLVPFVVVYLIAYLLDPVVSAARRRWGVPRGVSSMLLTVLSVGVLVLLIVLIVPNLLGRIEALAAGVLQSLAGLETWVMESALIGRLEEAGYVTRADLQAQLAEALPDQLGGIVATVPEALRTVLTSVSTIIALITVVTLVPVLLYYTLKDFPTIRDALIGLFPTVGGEREYLTHATHVVGSYLRGQITISAIGAFNIGLLLTLFGVPFSLLIGVVAGLLNMIPQIGVILTNVLGIGIALLFGTPTDVLVVVLVILGQQLLEGAILSPNILSYEVGLHPILIILSLLVFGATMGLLGLLIAVPLTALLVTFYQTYREEMTLELAGYAAPEQALIVTPEQEAREAARAAALREAETRREAREAEARQRLVRPQTAPVPGDDGDEPAEPLGVLPPTAPPRREP